MLVGRLKAPRFHAHSRAFKFLRSQTSTLYKNFSTSVRSWARQGASRSPLNANSASARDPTRAAWALRYGEEVQIYAAPNHRTFHAVAYATGAIWTAIGVDTLLRAYDKRSGYWATLLNEGIALVTAFLAFRAFKSPHRLVKELWLQRPKTAGNTATLKVVRRHHLALLGQKPIEEAAVSYATITRHYDPTIEDQLARDVRLGDQKSIESRPQSKGLVQRLLTVKEEMPYVYFWKAAPSTAYVSLPKEKSFFTRSEEKHFKLDGRGLMAARDGIIGLNVIPLREEV